MIIETVEKYNQRKLIEYAQDCDNWLPSKGGFPQIAFYLFDKKYGYVASGNNRAYWRKTKRDAIAAFEGANK